MELLEVLILGMNRYMKKIPTIVYPVLIIGFMVIGIYALVKHSKQVAEPVLEIPAAVTPKAPMTIEEAHSPQTEIVDPPKVKPVEQPTEGPVTEEPQDTTTREERGEAIKNFTVFDAKLVDRLSEDYGDVLGRNLARRIHNNLITGNTDMASLEDAIADELGSAASKEQVLAVKQKVVDIISEIADQRSQ